MHIGTSWKKYSFDTKREITERGEMLHQLVTITYYHVLMHINNSIWNDILYQKSRHQQRSEKHRYIMRHYSLDMI